MVAFFTENNAWPYQGVICLWCMLRRINIYYFILYLFLTINCFIFKWMVLITSNFYFDNFKSGFKSVVLPIEDKQDFRNFLACLIWVIESSFEVLSLDNILINRHCLINAKDHIWWKLLHFAMQLLHNWHL